VPILEYGPSEFKSARANGADQGLVRVNLRSSDISALSLFHLNEQTLIFLTGRSVRCQMRKLRHSPARLSWAADITSNSFYDRTLGGFNELVGDIRRKAVNLSTTHELGRRQRQGASCPNGLSSATI
jgi:hypothetical protein